MAHRNGINDGLNRRTFLRRFAGAGSLLLAPGAVKALYAGPLDGRPAAVPDRIGVQLYTVRDRLQEDFEGTIEQVAEIGYGAVEFAGYYNRTPERIRELLDRLFDESPDMIDVHEIASDSAADPSGITMRHQFYMRGDDTRGEHIQRRLMVPGDDEKLEEYLSFSATMPRAIKLSNEEEMMSHAVVRMIVNFCLYISMLQQRDEIDLTKAASRPKNSVRSATHAAHANGAKLAVRQAVRGHFRNQAHGPGRKLRKLIWIEPHMRGPDLAETVRRTFDVT